MTDRKLIIFDFDGTLVEGHQGFVEALKEFSEARGLPYDGVKMGIGYINPLKYDLGWGVTLDEQRKLLKEVNDFYHEEITTTKRFLPFPFEGAENVLDALSHDYDLAIVTARHRSSLCVTLEHYGWNKYFPIYRSLCCANDRGYAIKPAPDALDCLITETGHKKENCIVIGDTTADIDMANNAGVKSVAVLWGVHPKEKLETVRPTKTALSLKELPEIIKEVFHA